MNSLARRSLLFVLLCACSGGPISDYPHAGTDDDGSGDGDLGDGDGDADKGDGDADNGDGDGAPQGESDADAGTGYEPNPGNLDGGTDAEVDDGGVDPAADAGDAGFAPIGTLSGDLNVLDTELSASESVLFVNHFDLGTLDPTNLSEADLARLTPGSQRMLEEGGFFTSLTDLISYEVLARAEGAELLKLGTEIAYDNLAGKKANYLVHMDGTRIGVTTTRARSIPTSAEYTTEDATKLLTARLEDIALANANVSTADEWPKQILHILAYSEQHAAALQTAYAALGTELKGNTIVIITITDGDDAFLY